jgi:hypothetical protein
MFHLFDEMHATLIKGAAGLFGVTLATFHDAITFLGDTAREWTGIIGCFVALLMAANLSLDLRRKLREDRQAREARTRTP